MKSPDLKPRAFASDATHKSVLVVADLELNAMLFDHLTAGGWVLDYVGDNEAALQINALRGALDRFLEPVRRVCR